MKQVDANSSDGRGVYETTERCVWDGNEVTLVLDENGTIEHRFLHGPPVDQVFATNRPNGRRDTLRTQLARNREPNLAKIERQPNFPPTEIAW